MGYKDDIPELAAEVVELKEKCNAIILVHNYQRPEVQDRGDFVGDSLGLAQEAAKTDADRIKVASIQGGIREILIDKQLGRSTDEIVEALPETLPKGLIRHCVRRMDDVYKECGRHYLR